MPPNEYDERSLFNRLRGETGSRSAAGASRREEVIYDDYLKLDSFASAQRRIDDLTDSFTAEADALREDIKNANSQIGKLKSENVSFRAKQIEVIGIMVAFFTFISVQVQIFSNVDARFFFPLSLLFFSALLLFIAIMSVVNLVRIEDLDKRFYIPVVFLGLMSMGMLYSGIVMYNTTLQKLSVCEAGGRDFIMRQLSSDELNKISSGDKQAIEKFRSLQLRLDAMGCNK